MLLRGAANIQASCKRRESACRAHVLQRVSTKISAGFQMLTQDRHDNYIVPKIQHELRHLTRYNRTHKDCCSKAQNT